MTTLLWVLGALVGVGGVVAGVVYFVKKAVSNEAAGDEARADLSAEKDRVAAQEAEAAQERAAREKAFDAKAAAVHTPGDAAELLREASGNT